MRPPRHGRLRITPCLRICFEESSEVRRETRVKTSARHGGCLLFFEWALSDPFKVLLIINFITRRSECAHPFLFSCCSDSLSFLFNTSSFKFTFWFASCNVFMFCTKQNGLKNITFWLNDRLNREWLWFFDTHYMSLQVSLMFVEQIVSSSLSWFIMTPWFRI